jgi:glutathione reductase (NADPH)
MSKSGIELIRGKATFVDPCTVDVGGARYTAPHILIASGGAPTIPDVPGKELGIDSDGFFALEALPKKAAIVGSGYVAVELAGILRALGAEVHLLIRHGEFLRSFDASIRAQLMEEMGKPGADIHIHKHAHVRTCSTDWLWVFWFLVFFFLLCLSGCQSGGGRRYGSAHAAFH